MNVVTYAIPVWITLENGVTASGIVMVETDAETPYNVVRDLVIRNINEGTDATSNATELVG